MRRSRQADACRRGITRHPGFVEISGATILADGLAIVQRLDEGEVLPVLVDDVGYLVEDGGTLGRRGFLPAIEGLPCGLHGLVDVRGTGLCLLRLGALRFENYDSLRSDSP